MARQRKEWYWVFEREEESYHIFERREKAADVWITEVDNRANADLITQCPNLYEAGKEVMALLNQHGGAIVPHLLDTDDNPGEFLRQALAKAEGKDGL